MYHHNTKAHTTQRHATNTFNQQKGDHTSNFNPLKAAANITEIKMTTTKNALRKFLKKAKTMKIFWMNGVVSQMKMPMEELVMLGATPSKNSQKKTGTIRSNWKNPVRCLVLFLPSNRTE
jgi:hypothetical protein